MSRNSSIQGLKHPYLRTEKWIESTMHFWECGLYSEKTKTYYRDWLDRMIKDDKRLPQ